jgi:hypothetical protein
MWNLWWLIIIPRHLIVMYCLYLYNVVKWLTFVVWKIIMFEARLEVHILCFDLAYGRYQWLDIIQWYCIIFKDASMDFFSTTIYQLPVDSFPLWISIHTLFYLSELVFLKCNALCLSLILASTFSNLYYIVELFYT